MLLKITILLSLFPGIYIQFRQVNFAFFSSIRFYFLIHLSFPLKEALKAKVNGFILFRLFLWNFGVGMLLEKAVIVSVTLNWTDNQLHLWNHCPWYFWYYICVIIGGMYIFLYWIGYFNPFFLSAPYGFLMFWGGREMVHWEQVG